MAISLSGFLYGSFVLVELEFGYVAFCGGGGGGGGGREKVFLEETRVSGEKSHGARREPVTSYTQIWRWAGPARTLTIVHQLSGNKQPIIILGRKIVLLKVTTR